MTRARELAELGSAYDSGSSLGFRNRIINGDMRIDQRGSASTPVTTGSYVNDRWYQGSPVVSKISTQQSTTAPAGYANSLASTVSNAYTPTASEVFRVLQKIEGLNTVDLAWGSASASAVTLSFWVRSSVTGTYAVSFQNSANTRSYVATYTVNSASTWEQKTVTVAGDTSGTWLTTNGTGIQVAFCQQTGANFQTTAGSWQAGEYYGVSGAASWLQTAGATFYITGVQLEAGTVATPFERRDYGRELQMCQRYFYKTTGGNNTRHAISGNGSLPQSFPTVFFKVTMRAVPTVSVSSVSHFNIEALNGAGSVVTTSISWNAGDTDSATFNVTSAGSGGVGTNLLGTNPSAVLGYSAEL